MRQVFLLALAGQLAWVCRCPAIEPPVAQGGVTPVPAHSMPSVAAVRVEQRAMLGFPVAAPPNPVGLQQEAQPMLTLADLEKLALANNPTLPAAAALVQQAQGTWQQVGLYPNP